MRSILFLLAILSPTYTMAQTQHKNVLGMELEICSTSPLTGFYRDGYCKTDAGDKGVHVVSAIVTREFLDFTKSKGNDLETPNISRNFPGLKPGDGWCLCALRWQEAEEAGVAPLVKLESSHKKALEYISLEKLKQYQIKP